ncbi:MAG: ribonuclease P protein component [Bacilli bacterium]|nr:ribonuclease P protein component [Bacilli bacterium]
MKKEEIIKKNLEFEKIIKKGKKYKNKYFSIFILKKNNDKTRIGITVPKNIEKAVIRNKIKRQIKDVISKNSIALINNDCIILVRKEILNLKFEEIKNNFISLYNLIKEDEKDEKN